MTEELCGHAFSASAISAINQRLDPSLAAFAQRRLGEPFAYLILDARDEAAVDLRPARAGRSTGRSGRLAEEMEPTL